MASLQHSLDELNQVEDCYESNPEMAKRAICGVEGCVKYLRTGGEESPAQGSFIEEIQRHSGAGLHEFKEWLRVQSKSADALALALCEALYVCIGNPPPQQRQMVFNCVYGLRRALERLDADVRRRAGSAAQSYAYVPKRPLYESFAFHPDMNFGEQKYSRAV